LKQNLPINQSYIITTLEANTAKYISLPHLINHISLPQLKQNLTTNQSYILTTFEAKPANQSYTVTALEANPANQSILY
jgi:hypothetical protein